MRTRPWITAALLISLVSSPARAESPLGLGEVLESVYTYHPKAAQTRAKVASARGAELAARGAFDFQVALRGEAHPLGKKAYSLLDMTLLQPTTLRGVMLFAGINASAGDVPAYKDSCAH